MNIPLLSTRTFKHQSTTDCNGGVRFSKTENQNETNDSPTWKQAVGRETKVPFIFENKSPANVQNQKLQNKSTSEILKGVSVVF